MKLEKLAVAMLVKFPRLVLNLEELVIVFASTHFGPLT